MRCCIASSIMSSSDQHNSALARSPRKHAQAQDDTDALKEEGGMGHGNTRSFLVYSATRSQADAAESAL